MGVAHALLVGPCTRLVGPRGAYFCDYLDSRVGSTTGGGEGAAGGGAPKFGSMPWWQQVQNPFRIPSDPWASAPQSKATPGYLGAMLGPFRGRTMASKSGKFKQHVGCTCRCLSCHFTSYLCPTPYCPSHTAHPLYDL